MTETKTQNDRADYMPQLDGLRAFAVGAVLFHHFFQPARIGGVDLALLGVWLFFVLSGFLITGILLRSRDQVDYSGYSERFRPPTILYPPLPTHFPFVLFGTLYGGND